MTSEAQDATTPTEVYIVTTGEYSDYHILGVWLDKELAEEARKRFRADFLEVWSVVRSNPPAMDIWEVTMAQDGQVLNYWHRPPRAEDDGTWEEPTTKSKDRRVDQGEIHYHNLHGRPSVRSAWRMVCLAKDKEHAIKIANERRTQLIATEQW